MSAQTNDEKPDAPARPAGGSDAAPERALGDPYCGRCGHSFKDLYESTKCPECGAPIIDVLMRHGKAGRRFRSAATVFGVPILSIAQGPTMNEPQGHARGVLALGDRATGVVAVGGVATGIVAVGGFARGIFTVGGWSFGLVSAWGFLAVGILASGFCGIGVLASGLICFGIFSIGVLASGIWTAGMRVLVDARRLLGVESTLDSQAGLVEWFYGSVSGGLSMIFQPMIITIMLAVIVGAAFAVAAILLAMTRGGLDDGETPA